MNELINLIYKQLETIENRIRALDVEKADLEHEYRAMVKLLKSTGTEAGRDDSVNEDGIVEELPICERCEDDGK